MGAMDILDEVIDIYKSNFALLLGVAAILYVPISIIKGLATDYRPFGASGLGNLADDTIRGHSDGRARLRNIRTLPQQAGVHHGLLPEDTRAPSAAAFDLRRPDQVPDCDRSSDRADSLFSPHIPRDPLLMTPQQVLRLLAFCVLAIIGLIWTFVFGVKMLLVEPALVIERKGALRSIARSWKATGKFLEVRRYLCTGGPGVRDRVPHSRGSVQFPITQNILAGLPVSAASIWLMTILSTIISTLSVPVFAAARILLYYDVRIRKEAFDLEMLAAELDRKAKETAVGDITALPHEKSIGSSPDGESR